MAMKGGPLQDQVSNHFLSPQNSSSVISLASEVGWYPSLGVPPAGSGEGGTLELLPPIQTHDHTGRFACFSESNIDAPYSTIDTVNGINSQTICQQTPVPRNTTIVAVPCTAADNINENNRDTSNNNFPPSNAETVEDSGRSRYDDISDDDAARTENNINGNDGDHAVDSRCAGGDSRENQVKYDVAETRRQFMETECLECGRFFISFEHYQTHLNYHASEKANSFQENNHYKANDDLGGFNCLECGKHYSRKDHVKRHLKSHERQRAKDDQAGNGSDSCGPDLSCSECGKLYKRLDLLKRHEKNHEKRGTKGRGKTGPNTGYSCAECGKRYKRIGHFKRHTESHENRQPDVNLGISSKIAIETEADADCDIDEEKNDAWEAETDDNDDAEGCPAESVKGEDVPDSTHVGVNESACDNQTESVEVSDTIDSAPNLTGVEIPEGVEESSHFQPSELSMMEEEETGKLYTATLNFKSLEETKGKYGCSECGKHFQRMYRLRRHQLGHEARRRKEELRRIRLAEEENSPGFKGRKHKLVDVYCQVCNKHFNRTDHLKRHEMIHLPGRIRAKATVSAPRVLPYKCDQCTRSFSKAEFLDKHKITHMKKCEFCEERFPTKVVLKEHMVIHKGEMPNICHVCGKLFHLRKQLQKHKEVHRPHDPNFQPFVCPECDFTCRSKKILQRHQADHYGRRFMCQICGKAFKVRVDLTKHSIIHSGTKNHKCPICGKAFFVAKDMRRHVKVHRR